MLTPEEIDKIQFKATRLKEGYDQEEVDSFLDRVAADYALALDDLAKAKDRIASLERRNNALTNQPTVILPGAPPTGPAGVSATPSASVEGILRMAQETADRHVAEAEAKADEIVHKAGAKAAQVVEEANEAAERIRVDARKSANEIIALAQGEANEVASRKEQLSEQLQKLHERRRDMKAWAKETYERMEREDGSRG